MEALCSLCYCFEALSTFHRIALPFPVAVGIGSLSGLTARSDQTVVACLLSLQTGL